MIEADVALNKGHPNEGVIQHESSRPKSDNDPRNNMIDAHPV